ncbi:hypothetical protein [Pedobacter alluvionis]|uniref:Uncharacterized protein n=1 Tax=Pedobacter alluvionis TaxID=475253 RepID=A0A497XMK2_9SPHI|nr:hypothetical protein [Pedobacter alluvionis]RLJ69212.1 hypothetical protein BCL90_5310 [Pedobacter alluvionis]TFB29757.1 hypothetical protein E3V97_16325 [Pedobacter alluvionis]
MIISYFKPRDRFDFSNDTLDIGNPLSWNRSTFLKHFFKRVFAISEDRLEEFYRHHLSYFLTSHLNGTEEIFFKHLWELIEGQLKVLTGKDVYDSNHVRNQREIKRLKIFTEVLIPLDQWNFHKSNFAVVAQLEMENHELKQQVKQLKADLLKANKLETKQYINIPKGRLLAFIDLCVKLRTLKVEEKDELLFTDFPIVWVKLICKYFRNDDQEIDFEGIRGYFYQNLENPGNRARYVSEDQKLFEIKRLRKRR